MSYGLGVDLGTSFTGCAVSRAGRPQMVTLSEPSILMPSIVRVQPDGALAAGDTGAPDAEVDPGRIGRDFKRRLGDPTPLVLGGQPHSAVSLLAATLSSVVRTVTAREGSAPARVTLTCPAVWGPYRREQFAEVPRRAGLDPDTVTILTEPEAAATHYAARQGLATGDIVAVYDLGGGTFDTTVTKRTDAGMEILGDPEGVEWVGGVDFDEAVLSHVDAVLDGAVSALDPRDPAAAGALQRIRDECVRAKEALSQDTATNIVILLPDHHVEVRLTRDEFEDMIRTPLESTLAALHRTMASAGVTPAELAGVLLVGGSSRIPLVSRMLAEEFGRPVLVDPQPQHCVALGAAAIADPPPYADAPDAGRPAAAIPVQKPRRLRRRVLATALGATLVLAGTAYLTYSPVLSDIPEVDVLAADPDPRPVPVASSTTPEATRTSATASAAPVELRAVPLSVRKAPALPHTSNVLGLGALCMDIVNARSENGSDIQLFGCNKTKAQDWTMGRDGTFRALGACMDVGPRGEGGPVVEVQACTGKPDQRWQLRSSGAIVNAGSKQCLDVRGGRGVDRAPLVTATCTKSKSQIWSVPPVASAIDVVDSAATARPAGTIRGIGRRPQGVAISPDGARAYVPSVNGNSLAVIETTSGRLVRRISMPTAPQYVTAAPDGRRLYVTLNDAEAATNSVEVVDAVTGDLLRRIKVGKMLFSPAVSPDGRRLLVPDHASSTVTVLDTATYEVKARIKVPEAPHWAAFTPDGVRAFVVGHETGLISVVDVDGGRVLRDFGAGVSPLAIAMSPNGRQVAIANYDDRTVSLVGTGDNGVEVKVTVGKNPQSVAYAPDGQHVYVVNDGSDSVSVIDTGTRRVTSTVRVGDEPWQIAVTPDGRRAFVTNATSDTVTVLDTAS